MVSIVSSGSKKTPPSIRTPSVHSPVLVSPISVAHRNKMQDNDGGSKKTNNWMRDQWVANLKKKSLANAAGGVVPGVQLSVVPAAERTPSTSGGGRAAKVGGRSNSRRSNTSNTNNNNQQQQLTIPPLTSNSHSFGEKDNLGLTHPAMFFNDLGCFEIESQSFTRLVPSTGDFDHLLNGPSDSSLLDSNSYSVDATPTKPAAKSRGGGGGQKKTTRSAPKKRTKCSALDLSQPKPRTPRRKLNCGNAFEDFDTLPSSNPTSSSQCFSSVGTPSNFNAEVSRMWGHDLDFGSGSYVDTFLDLPTPKSAEMPTMQTQQQQQQSYQSSTNILAPSHSHSDDLSLPKLIRTNSIEQEGLSHFFEQTTLGGDSSLSSQHHLSHNSSSVNDLYAQQQLLARYPPAHHHQIKKNQIDLGSSGHHVGGPYSQAAMSAVDECFSKILPSPHAPRRNSLLASSSMSAASQYNSLSRLLSSTPRGPGGILRTPRGPSGEYNFDHKNMPEFETLLDEYKFTDIDQELDSFYLDTIESFGGDLDLISN